MDKPLILIGFKSVGKSVLGAGLAKRLRADFIDLDHTIETHYSKTHGFFRSCREITQAHGMAFFRHLETQMLEASLKKNPSIVSVGGGAPLCPINQGLLSQGLVIHVRARKGLVFERIMVTGRPAFFPLDEDLYEAFSRIWEERLPIYESLAQERVDNHGTIEQAIHQLSLMIQEEILE